MKKCILLFILVLFIGCLDNQNKKSNNNEKNEILFDRISVVEEKLNVLKKNINPFSSFKTIEKDGDIILFGGDGIIFIYKTNENDLIYIDKIFQKNIIKIKIDKSKLYILCRNTFLTYSIENINAIEMINKIDFKNSLNDFILYKENIILVQEQKNLILSKLIDDNLEEYDKREFEKNIKKLGVMNEDLIVLLDGGEVQNFEINQTLEEINSKFLNGNVTNFDNSDEKVYFSYGNEKKIVAYKYDSNKDFVFDKELITDEKIDSIKIINNKIYTTTLAEGAFSEIDKELDKKISSITNNSKVFDFLELNEEIYLACGLSGLKKISKDKQIETILNISPKSLDFVKNDNIMVVSCEDSTILEFNISKNFILENKFRINSNYHSLSNIEVKNDIYIINNNTNGIYFFDNKDYKEIAKIETPIRNYGMNRNDDRLYLVNRDYNLIEYEISDINNIKQLNKISIFEQDETFRFVNNIFFFDKMLFISTVANNIKTFKIDNDTIRRHKELLPQNSSNFVTVNKEYIFNIDSTKGISVFSYKDFKYLGLIKLYEKADYINLINDNLYIATSKSIYKFEIKSNILKKIYESDLMIKKIQGYNNNLIILDYYKGLIILENK